MPSLNLFAPTKPHAKQQEVLDALDGGARWVLLRAGRKFRKTSLIISWLLEGAIKTGLTCPYIGPNKIQAKNIAWDDHIARILDHFKEVNFPYKVNETELSIEVPSIADKGMEWKGGKLQLHGVENAESLRGISNWGRVGLDEYDDWNDDIWPLIIRPNLIPHQAPALIAGTPKGYKNLYRLEFPVDKSGDPIPSAFKCFNFASHDNPDLSQQELEDLEREYKSMGEGFYRQEILAQYERPQGTVYQEWPDKNFTHFEYDPFLPLHISMDFGVNDPTAIIWMQPSKSDFRIIDYYETSDASVEHFVQVIRSKPYKRPDLITGDAAGKARSITTNTSPIEEYAKFGLYIKTKDGLQIPDQIRITHKYMSMLYLNQSTCGRLKDCLLNYRYPEKKTSMLNQSNENPIHDWSSHGMRALEYYFANIDGGSLFKDYSDTKYMNKALLKKWRI
jgi:hypothetical protein